MAQGNPPANSHFLSATASAADTENNKTPRNGGQAINIDSGWDVWLPMLPQLDELPWTLQDIAKVLRLGRTRENFRAITPQAVERVSFLLQRPLLRIVREVKRLSVRYSKCSKQEIQTSIRLVLSLSMAKNCLILASKALSLYFMSTDRFRRSKRTRSGLILPVGKMFRWLVNMKVASRIYDAGVIYLSACLEYIAEELVYRTVTNLDGMDQVTPEVLEEWINTDVDFWGIFQPYYHLLSGRTAFGITQTIEAYATPKKGLASNSPKVGSPGRRGLDKSLATTCVTSVAELSDLVLQTKKRFAEVYHSKDKKFISQVDWTPNALHTLFYFMKCSHQVDEDISDTLAATRRAHSHLPPLVEWLRISCLHAEHRFSGLVDDDDVRQTARLLLPFNDCEPRSLCSVDSLCGSRALSSAATTASFQQDLGLRMLVCGRRDIIQQALAMLGPEKVNTINIQGMTPLMYACVDGNEALVKTLIEHHALLDTQVPNNQQIYPLLNLELKAWTALSFAAMKGHTNICQLLLNAGASPNGAIDYGRDSQVETPLQLASAAGNYELVSILLRKGADPYISVNTASFSPGSRGFGNAFAAAAAHGHKNILRKLLAEPGSRRDTDMLSLAEILSEGSLKDGGDTKLTRKRSKALEEAMYHSCEHGCLDITMELRSLGVPWNIHCWGQTVGHAYERAQKSFLRCLLRDFRSMSSDEYTDDFCDDGLVILFNIFKECEDLALSKELASVLSCCFGSEPLQEIKEHPDAQTSIRIGPDYINNAEMSDITFTVEGRPFYAHKIILATASKRFKAMLSNTTVESNDGSSPCIEINDIKYEIFTLVIQFLYSGMVDQPNDQVTILELLQASDFFMLDPLKRHCERLSADHLDCENVMDTYSFAKLCSAKELLAFCEGFILKNLVAMMDVKNFRDTMFNNNCNEMFAALKSSLVQRIKSRSLAKMHGRSSFKV